MVPLLTTKIDPRMSAVGKWACSSPTSFHVGGHELLLLLAFFLKGIPFLSPISHLCSLLACSVLTTNGGSLELTLDERITILRLQVFPTNQAGVGSVVGPVIQANGRLSKSHVGPQTLFAWDLHSQWMQTLQNTFTIILWE